MPPQEIFGIEFILGDNSLKFKYIETKDSNKLDLDKYYTSYEDMKYCVHKALSVLNKNNYSISEFLEPSAGSGVFSNYLRSKKLDVIAIDIEPESDGIIAADFLKYPIEYKKDRCIIGNPPYGNRLNLASKFFKKGIEISDYIVFILPISQLNNRQSFYQFDLLHSEDLGELIFSGCRKVHCCLNIYVRPESGLNKKTSHKLKDIEIVRQDSKKYKDFEYDLRMCYWGDATAGKILSDNESYSGEYKIKIHNEDVKDEVIQVLSNIDWKTELKSTAMCRIKQYHIIEALKKYVPNIK